MAISPDRSIAQRLVNDISPVEGLRLRDGDLSLSLGFFSLPMGIGLNYKGPSFYEVIRATINMYVL